MAATRVVMHQIVLPAEVDTLGICFGGQVRCRQRTLLARVTNVVWKQGVLGTWREGGLHMFSLRQKHSNDGNCSWSLLRV